MAPIGDTRKTIQDIAVKIIQENPGGIRYTRLCFEVETLLPAGVNPNSIPANIVRLVDDRRGEVFKPARGIFAPVVSTVTSTISLQVSPPPTASPIPSLKLPPPSEDEFYEPFAEYLKGELDECTRAMALGGHTLGRKWGTPDVIGTYQSKITDIIKEEPVIVSSEIKNDDRDLITGFGQACSYRLFSHKVYLVIPSDSDAEEKGRVEALCQLFGIGLVLFDRKDPAKPAWEIRVRATRNEPDLFYVNEILTPIARELFGP